MRRAGDEPDLLVRQFVAVVDVLHDGLVVARDDALDGRDHEFVAERRAERFEEGFQVGRRGGQDDHLGLAHHGVEVVRRGDAVAVEFRVVEVAGVAAFGAEAFEHLAVADVPAHAPSSRGEQFDERRRPTAVADDGAAGVCSDFVFHAERFSFGIQM